MPIIMNKIIALNWKHVFSAPLIKGDKGGFEEAYKLMKTVEDVVNIYPDYSWIVFPGDELVSSFLRRQESIPEIQLGTQKIDRTNPLPYSLIGHMSQRVDGKTVEEIQEELESVIDTAATTPILCVGPMREKDTLELVLREQLTVLQNWPKERKIIIAYEPGFAIGTGKTMTLEDIEIVYDILREAMKEFSHHIIYGGSVNDHNIAQILRITDGVIIGTASQKSSSLLALSIAL